MPRFIITITLILHHHTYNNCFIDSLQKIVMRRRIEAKFKKAQNGYTSYTAGWRRKGKKEGEEEREGEREYMCIRLHSISMSRSTWVDWWSSTRKEPRGLIRRPSIEYPEHGSRYHALRGVLRCSSYTSPTFSSGRYYLALAAGAWKNRERSSSYDLRGAAAPEAVATPIPGNRW